MQTNPGAWVGWSGDAGEAPAPFVADGMYLLPIGLSPDDVRDYYEGFSNDTLWPVYHDVIVPASFHREWWAAYERINRRFADSIGICTHPNWRTPLWASSDWEDLLLETGVRHIRGKIGRGSPRQSGLTEAEAQLQLAGWTQHYSHRTALYRFSYCHRNAARTDIRPPLAAGGLYFFWEARARACSYLRGPIAT